MKFASIVEAIGHTPLVELRRFSPRTGVRIFAKLEGHNPTGSVKDRIARYADRGRRAGGQDRPGHGPAGADQRQHRASGWR